MQVKAGDRLGNYEVLSRLGAGGMGEVFRALDTRLGREVAIKLVLESRSRDPEQLQRFQREARVLAAMQHPHIATLFGLEEANGVHFLVMELVPGETLAERLRGGPLRIVDALDLARQIAEALEAAHEKSVIHRDLKPANIKVTPDGDVKVLDFGLAKSLDTHATAVNPNQPTLAEERTREGVILGTPTYMSPEQARGRNVDRRTDIWAFGCILYEMLTGRPVFLGETISDVLAAVLEHEPDETRLPANLSPRICELIRRCLHKEPMRRLRDMGDARLELEQILDHDPKSILGPEQMGVRPLPASKRWNPALGLGVAAAVVLAFCAGMWLQSGRSEPATAPGASSAATPPTVSIPNWNGKRLLGGPARAFGARVSPDGQWIAFQVLVDGQSQVGVMRLGTSDWKVLTAEKNNGSITDLCWSNDGTRVYFDRFADVPIGIYSVPIVGGEERPVLDEAVGGQVLPDGGLLVKKVDAERNIRFYRFAPETGKLEPVGPALTFNLGQLWSPLRVFADGKEAVFFGKPLGDTADVKPHLHVLNLATGKTRRLAPTLELAEDFTALTADREGRHVLTPVSAGDLVRIIAIPRDGDARPETRLTLLGWPSGLEMGPDGSIYTDNYDRPVEILRFARAGGAPERLATSTRLLSGFPSPLQLPDGRILLSASQAGRDRLLVLAPGKDPAPFVETRDETTLPAALLGEGQVAFLAGKSPDRKIAVASARDGRITRRLEESPGTGISALAAARDGKTIFYVESGTVWSIPAAGGMPQKLRAGDGVAVSPDGSELIIQLNEKEGVRLVRWTLDGGKEQPIPVKHDRLKMMTTAIAGNAWNKDGLLVMVGSKDSWFYSPALVDPQTGVLEPIPVTYDGDIYTASWGRDGKILTVGLTLKAELWQFQPVK